MVCSYRTIVCEFTATEKSPFEGGRGMNDSNYETIATTIEAKAEIPLLRGARGGWTVMKL